MNTKETVTASCAAWDSIVRLRRKFHGQQEMSVEERAEVAKQLYDCYGDLLNIHGIKSFQIEEVECYDWNKISVAQRIELLEEAIEKSQEIAPKLHIIEYSLEHNYEKFGFNIEKWEKDEEVVLIPEWFRKTVVLFGDKAHCALQPLWSSVNVFLGEYRFKIIFDEKDAHYQVDILHPLDRDNIVAVGEPHYCRGVARELMLVDAVNAIRQYCK